MPQRGLEASAPRWRRTDVILLAAGIPVAIWMLSDVLIVVFFAVILAVGLDGVASALSRRSRLRRGWALLGVCIAIPALLAGAGAAALPQVVRQFGALRERLQTLTEALRHRFALDGWPGELMANMEENGAQLVGGVNQLVTHLGAVGVSTLGGVVSTFVLVVLAGFLAADPALYRSGLLRLVPPARRPLIDATLAAAAHGLRWWFLAQLASMAILGGSVGLGLYLIGIEYWLSLALITALLTFVPYLGPVIAGVPVIAIGFTEGAEIGVIVLIFYLVVQNIESTLVLPLIYQKAVRLAPAVTISAQVLMGLWFGVAGLVLAAPLTVVVQVLVARLYLGAVLGEAPEHRERAHAGAA